MSNFERWLARVVHTNLWAFLEGTFAILAIGLGLGLPLHFAAGRIAYGLSAV
jgi:hypothetical protein